MGHGLSIVGPHSRRNGAIKGALQNVVKLAMNGLVGGPSEKITRYKPVFREVGDPLEKVGFGAGGPIREVDLSKALPVQRFAIPAHSAAWNQNASIL